MRRAPLRSLRCGVACAAWAMLLCGCASVMPGADFPKAVSTAYATPASTWLGERAAQAAAGQPHADFSGYRVLSAGLDGFLLRTQLTEHAQRSLDLQYFILRGDVTGQLLAAAVRRAALRGVRVRVLIDDGETLPGDEPITALDAQPGIEVRIFNPWAYRGHLEFLRGAEFLLHLPRLDYRMHNKLFVADNAVALIGGRNISDAYFQVDPQMQFADDDVFVIGPMVRRLSASFDDYWNSASAIPVRALGAEPAAALMPAAPRADPGPAAPPALAAGIDLAHLTATTEPLQGLLGGGLPLVWAHGELVSDSPDKQAVQAGASPGRLMRRPVADAIADVQSELLMITPYLIPGPGGMSLLQGLRERGVKVQMLTNSLQSSTVSAAQAGYVRWRVPLLEAGVDLFELRSLPGNSRGSGESARLAAQGNYSLHAKLFVFDRRRLFIGSMNFDPRSLHLNTEAGLIIDSPELALQAAARFAAMTQAANAFQVLLDDQGLAWRTRDASGPVQLRTEPARSTWQRIKVDLLTLLPLDPEL